MQLDELFDYKNRLMRDILASESIPFLIDPEIDPSETYSLAYKQVFPYERIPETIEDGLTYVCFDVDIQRSVNKTFLRPTIYIWVLVHDSNMRLPEGGLRLDKILSELSKALNGSRFYGMGELDLQSVKRFAPVTGYIGKVMTFNAVEWNRPAVDALSSHHGKKTPGNRKTNNVDY